jgi:3-dehydroquinate synthase
MKIIAKSKNFLYPIIVGSDILRLLPREISKFTKSKKIFILIDTFLSKKFERKLKNNFKNHGFECSLFKVEAGKKCKELKVLLKIIDLLQKNKFTKDSTLLAFGGGTIGDLGGFASSIYYRGLNLVQIPTTLTAQIDSSLGGKVAINYNNNINAIGNYHHPKLIICDYNFIKTLPKRDFLSGLAEVIKSALISSKNDTKFLEKNYKKILTKDKNTILTMVSKIIKIKLHHVSKDEKEKNVRMFLNYGHTIGQAIESSFPLKMEHYRHGEAVALGMLCVSFIGEKYFNVKNLFQDHIKILKKFQLPQKIYRFNKSKNQMLKIILKNISKDKKKNYTGVRYVLLKGIGRPEIVSNVGENIVKESILKLLD